MRIVFSALLFSLFFVSAAKAEDAKFYSDVYSLIKKEYINEIDVRTLAESALNGLTKMDKKLKISNGNQTISLYYDGKMMKSITKPSGYNNAEEWGMFTKKIIDIAAKISPQIAKKDFETQEYILLSITDALDKDSKYYPYLDLGEKRNDKKQRYFADRMIGEEILYMKFGPLNLYTKEKILESIKKNEGFKSVIIDLRGNPGGLISEAVEIVKIFLDEGIIASSKTREIGSTEYYVAEKDKEIEIVKNKPIVVIVDGNTMSSAEMLAAALKQQVSAKLIGTRTGGKGTIQKLIKLDNSGELVLTNAYFFTPSGDSINGTGMRPDLCLTDISDNDDAVKVNSENNIARSCYKQSRKDYNIDIDVAVEMLRN